MCQKNEPLDGKMDSGARGDDVVVYPKDLKSALEHLKEEIKKRNAETTIIIDDKGLRYLKILELIEQSFPDIYDGVKKDV